MSPARSGPAPLPERFRRDLWRSHGASDEQAGELVAYAASPLHAGPPPLPMRYPLPDEPSVAAWVRYAAEAESEGAFVVLQRVFVQLRFPVRSGMSSDLCYQAATRRGVLPDDGSPGLSLAHPEALRLFLHPTPAGRVPAILAGDRGDFDSLVQAITRHNEPVPVPAAMGACIVAGYNNWERVAARRRTFESQHPDATADLWAAAFRELIPRRELYQDRLILLSSGPYSSTPAEAVGLSSADWCAASVRLRLEHESTHYFTRHAFGSMRESLLDELVADYMGLVEAFGAFHPEHFLRFMGLERYPAYRDGGRLQNYRGAPPLSDAAFAVLPSAVKRAAENLGDLDPSRRYGRLGVARRAQVITALMSIGLEGLASDGARELLEAALSHAADQVPS